MVIDRELIRDGISPRLLAVLIAKHEEDRERFARLTDYYLGKHDINRRIKESGDAANNRVTANYAKYITQMSVAYFMGAPVTYAASEGHDIEELKDCYLEQAISSLDCQLAKQASICGEAVEMVYVNAESRPRSCILPASQAFVVYDDTVERRKLFGVHYYIQQKLDGTAGDAVAEAADEKHRYTFRGNGSFSGLVQTGAEPHYFGAVPFIEYLNNEERQGDYEQEISLMDAYDVLMSDRVNDKEQFVDAFLLLLGMDIDSDQAKKLRREKILCGEIGGSAEYLSKVLNEADTEVLRQAIKEDIHKLSMVPDLTDEEFAGNLSGVAIKYKLLGFEQAIRNKERLFERGLRERLALYLNFLHTRRNAPLIPLHRIDVEFHRNLPANELETAQMVSTLSGIVSDETLLTRVPFVTDAKEELKIAAKERRDKQNALAESVRDYSSPVKAGEDDEE
jgi:SPP1 family phage portal protein